MLENEKFEVHIKLIELPVSLKYPGGYKLSCALVECKSGILRLLLDNHEPFGYHLHTRLPEDKSLRIEVDVKNYEDALR